MGERKKCVASLSYGKDSIRMLATIKELGWPLDEVVTADVWATDTIPAELPEMVAFKDHVDEWVKQEFGLTVKHVWAVNKDGSKRTYEGQFHAFVPAERAKSGTDHIYGWPIRRGPWCNSRLKMAALDRARPDVKCISYIGIAADEPERIARHGIKLNIKMPLVEAGITEPEAMEWCRERERIVIPSLRGQRTRRLLVLS